VPVTEDVFVFLLVVIIFIIWAYIAFRRWLYKEPEVRIPESEDARRLSNEVVELLLANGYEVTHGKWKVDIGVHVDEHKLGSSLFIDYFARRGGKVYAVKVAKKRKPLDLTVGSAVREQLLPYALLYEETAGVLYVDVERGKVHQIRFALEL